MKVYKIISRILITIISVILGLLLLFSVYMAYNKIILKKSRPNFLGYNAEVVASNSMVPKFKKGDLLIIDKKDNYKVGDIITFEDEIGLCTHRIVEVTESGYITKGDANDSLDEGVVNKNEVLGKVVCVMDGVGIFIDFFKTPGGIIIALVLVALIVGSHNYICSLDAKENNNKKVKDKK